MKDQLTLTCLAESEGSALPRKQQGSGQSPSVKLNLTKAQSCASTGQTFRTSETLQSGESGQTSEMFPLLQAVSRVSRFPQPGTKEAQQMTVSSGRQCSMLLDAAHPLGCLVRTCLESSEWNSKGACLIWKASAFGRNRLLFQLAPLDLSIEETGCGFLPSPKASDFYRIRFSEESTVKSDYGNNVHSVNFWSIQTLGCRQNPALSEVLMGYPKQWTKCESKRAATPSSRKSRKSSSAPSTNS